MVLQNPYLSLLRTSWHYARHERGRFLLIYGMLTVSNLLLALEPVLWGWFINAVQQESLAVLRVAWVYALAYLSLHLLSKVLNGPARVMERDLAYRIGRHYLQEVLNRTLLLPLKWHQDHHSGATINRIRKAYDSLRYFYERGSAYLQSLIRFAFSLVAMIYFSPLFGSIAVMLGVLTIGLIRRFDRPTIAAMRQVQEREHTMTATLLDSLANITTVVTLRLEKRMESAVLNRVTAIFPVFHRYISINEWKWLVVGINIALIYVIIFLGYIYQNWTPGETFLLGGLVTLMGYVGNFNSVFNNIAWQYNEVVRYNTEVETAHIISEAFEQLGVSEKRTPLPKGWRSVEVRNLQFRYDGASGTPESAGLKDIHLRFARGQKVALVGESGSGKSTLLALLRGLYTAGPETTIKLESHFPGTPAMLAGAATLIPQEPEIFENTIEFNITLGLPFAADVVEKVCHVAHFSSVVAQLPNGLQSHIQEKGVNLSGGQKQRLALARGLLAARDSAIVLLDEPTSSVDPRTEQLIYEKIFAEFSDKAIIAALHRLHLLRHFDYIYVLDRGRIVEEGTLESLLREGMLFKELWRHQQE